MDAGSKFNLPSVVVIFIVNSEHYLNMLFQAGVIPSNIHPYLHFSRHPLTWLWNTDAYGRRVILQVPVVQVRLISFEINTGIIVTPLQAAAPKQCDLPTWWHPD
jgi:hypothetical protein